MLLDLQVAQGVVRAKLLERASHDPGPWTVRIGDTVVDAVRCRTPAGVRFLMHFDDVPDDDVAWLCCRGEELSSWDLAGALPAYGPFALQWKLSVPDDLIPATA